eukprot:c15973_g1_i2.p1 GENE.c15973_g1_i2~~c15973_g1_i2.p1  ORF type:complete len:434 (-),score=84.37 c15973_g1_i2:46-1347(-)
MPANGRSILGYEAAEILCNLLPSLAQQALTIAGVSAQALRSHVDSVEAQDELRSMLLPAGLVAFVRNGAILPRESGVSDAPLSSAVPFQSPASMQVSFKLRHCGEVTGMGIPRGVTVIVGGGFHGKSTLLRALEVGCYNKVPGDGREFVACDPNVAKIRSEDGRSVVQVDITPFINNLPHAKSTKAFSTPNASGSTSQAANIMEALEAGATTLLIDEDTSATNLMIRDSIMQQLIANDPITPFISKVRGLWSAGVSTVLVIGGCGAYFEVADHVIAMNMYIPSNVTEQARTIVANFKGNNTESIDAEAVPFETATPRRLNSDSLRPQGKCMARRRETIQYGETDVDLACVEQLVELSQTRAITDILTFMSSSQDFAAGLTVRECLEKLDRMIDGHGLDVCASRPFLGNLSRPRGFEVASAMNRVRTLSVQQLR